MTSGLQPDSCAGNHAAIAVLLLAIGTSAPALAQTPTSPPPTAGVTTPAKPKPVTTITVRPALQTPADTAGAMTAAERRAIQSDLAWAGKFNGTVNGEVSERMVAAIRAFQKDRKARETGVLNPQERSLLSATARKLQDGAGWRIITDAPTGARLGVPTRLVPHHHADDSGTLWSSPGGTISIALTRRKEAEPSSAKLAERARGEAERKVTYSVIRPDFFVMSGTQGTQKFYMRGSFRDSEVRILTVMYDPALQAVMEPVVIAMSSAFAPFPAAAVVIGPPPRKPVEYGTGVVVSADGYVVTDRGLLEGCRTVVISGLGNADRTFEDKTSDLALLRIYGAQGLKPLAISTAPVRTGVELLGIADPQNQGGGHAVSRVRAGVTSGAGGELTLTPAPGIGFSGAAALDGDGRLIGLAQLKQVVLAGVASVQTQAVLSPGAAIAALMKDSGVAAVTTVAGNTADPNAALVRVICIRK